MKKILSFFSVVVLLCAVFGAFAEETGEDKGFPDCLVVGSATAMNGNFFGTLFGNNTADLDVQRLLHDYNLVTWDNSSGGFRVNDTVVSGINVTENADGDREYTLALYHDLMYSDGTPITAWDYAFSVILSASPEIRAIGGSPVPQMCIVGMKEYMAGERDTITGVTVAGDDLMTFTVDHSFRPFFYEPGFLSFYPYPIAQIAPECGVHDDGNGIGLTNREAFTPEMLAKTMLDPEHGYISHPSVVSGPYQLVSFDGVTAEFSINPQYKGNRQGMLPTIPRLVFTASDNADAIRKLTDGSFTLINKSVSKEVIDEGIRQVQSGGVAMNTYVRNGLTYIDFCCERPAMQDQAVRQAIAYCFDKDSFVEDYVGNYGVRVDGYYGIGQWMYQFISGGSAYPVETPDENASAAQQKKYDEELARWEKLNLDGIRIYDLDILKAEQTLDRAGWDLNENGDKFVPGRDAVRCRQIGDELVPLRLTLRYPATADLSDVFDLRFTRNLAQAGIELTVLPTEFSELLAYHYRQTARDCDMIYLGTDFAVVFDPSANYEPEAAYHNTNAITDERLYELAVDMRRTDPGELLSYCEKWIAFQEYWTEVLPAIPVYSNAYFDFYSSALQDYSVNTAISWSEAVVNAYFGEPEAAAEEADMETDTDEDLVEFD